MSDEKPNLRKVKTGYFRMSFPALLQPRKNDEGNERYELTMLFPPGFDKKPFMVAFKNAMTEKYGPDSTKWPKLKRKPDDVIRDFAIYNAEANKPLAGDWTGWTMVRANASKVAPKVVGPIKGQDGKFPDVTDEREIYGGRWARATVEAYVYDRKDGKGVTLGLASVQLAKHDTKFGAAITAPEKDFDDVDASMLGNADDYDAGTVTEGATAGAEASPWD
jgi:hypothetical protein